MIAPDIYLEKELDLKLEGGEHPRYLFKIVSKSLRVITFEVDFTGSQNLLFYQDHTKQPLTDVSVFRKRIEPPFPT